MGIGGWKENALEQIAISQRKSAKYLAWGHATNALSVAQANGLDVTEDILGKANYPDCTLLERAIRAANNIVLVGLGSAMKDWLRQYRPDLYSDNQQEDFRGFNMSGKHVVCYDMPLSKALEPEQVTTIDLQVGAEPKCTTVQVVKIS